MSDLDQELLEEVARAAASYVVEEQAPARKAEHEGIAKRLIKFFIILHIFEISALALYLDGKLDLVWNTIDCAAQRVTQLEYEHIRDSEYQPSTCSKYRGT